MTDPRTFLRRLFDAAVAAADPMRVIPAALPPHPAGRVVVVGAGKASARMAEAVEAAWGPCEGLVITHYGHARPTRGVEIVEAAHPVPDAAGEAATRRMLALLQGCGEGDTVLALISGGASALLVAPAGGVSLADNQAVNRALLASGAPIEAIAVNPVIAQRALPDDLRESGLVVTNTAEHLDRARLGDGPIAYHVMSPMEEPMSSALATWNPL